VNEKRDAENSALELRRRAEQTMRERSAARPVRDMPHDVRALVHELETHQIELQLQNDELRRTQLELEVSRSQYADLYDSAPVGYFVLNRSGIIRSVNRAGAELLGMPSGHMLKVPFASYLVKEDQTRFVEHLAKVFAHHGKQDVELKALGADHSLTHLHLQSLLAPTEIGLPDMCRTVVMDITERVRMASEMAALNASLERRVEEVQRLSERLRRLATELTRTEQRERERMTTILHDHLQQLLVAGQMQLEVLRDPQAKQAEAAASELDKILADALAACHSLAVELNPPVLRQFGLAPALEWLATQFEKRHLLKVHVHDDKSAVLAAVELRGFLFDAIRELLLNVVKHSGVDEAWVTLSGREGRYQAQVEDRGRGFDFAPPCDPNVEGGIGLFSLQQRLVSMGGNLEVETAPGRGTRVTVTVPIV